MQPQEPYNSAPNPGQPFNNQAPAPDYGFLNEQPKKVSLLPSFKNTFIGKIFVLLFGAFIVVIILIIIKNIVSPAPFNKGAYQILVERQNEILHILNNDITSTAQGQLSQSDLNFSATANLALTTAQSKTLIFLNEYGDKINTQALANVFSSSVDQTLSGSIASNNFDSTFKSEMQQQLISYEQEIKTAYSGTHSTIGRSLMSAEYQEAQQLLTALNSSTS